MNLQQLHKRCFFHWSRCKPENKRIISQDDSLAVSRNMNALNTNPTNYNNDTDASLTYATFLAIIMS